MIRLFTLKEQKAAEDANGTSSKKKVSAAQLRVTKDINELSVPPTCKTVFENADDLLNFRLIICPDQGFYRGGKFIFKFNISNNYPHEPPKVKIFKKLK
jgi:ubiquitin-conjugating enzyme E2 M